MPPSALTLVCSLTTLCAASAAARADVHARRAVIRFDEHLGLSDLRLAGRAATRSVRFELEVGWRVVGGSALHLFLEHAPELDGNRSFLSISLNQGILRSLRLDESNRTPTEVVLPLPAAMLHRSNELVFSVEQFDAAGRGEPGAWSLVLARSFVSVEYAPEAPPLSLRELPLPLVDPGSYRPFTLTVVPPAEPSIPSVEAAAVLVAGIASRVAPKPLRVASSPRLSEATGAVLVVGTPSEQEEITPLLRGARFTVSGAGGDTRLADADGRALPGDAGVAGLVASVVPGQRAVLYVTSATPEGVRRAARALFAAAPRLEGATGVVPETPAANPGRRAWKETAPPGPRFALSDLGHPPAELWLGQEHSLHLAVRTTPDAHFLGDAASVALSLQLQPELFEDRSRSLVVAWNDRVLARFPVAALEPPQLVGTVHVPRVVLGRQNVLSIDVQGGMASSRGPLAFLLPDTGFYLPRSYAARLPDLALLEASLFPFSLRPDLSDLALVVPAPDAQTLGAVWELAALLGRLAPSDRPAFRVREDSGLTPGERASLHLWLLETGGHTLVDTPALDWQRLPGGPALRELPMLQELISPWNRDRFVLRLRARSAPALARAAGNLARSELLERLVGDTAFLAETGPVCYRVSSPREFSEVSYVTWVEAWLKTHWLALPVLALAVSAGLFLALRRALHQHRAAHLSSAKGASWRA